VSLQLAVLLVAHMSMACAAVDYSAPRPFAWTEFLGASYFLAIGVTAL
jgi:hypothetical protein